jgi:integrase
MASHKYVQRRYREGKVVAYMYKNGSVMRYKLLKIEKKWLTTTLQVKADYPLRNAEELNKEIDDLEDLVDKTITELLHDDPKLYITCAVIDKAIADKEKKAKEKAEENEKQLLLYDFKLFNKRKKEALIKKDIERGLNRKTPPTIKDYISACNAIEDFEYDFNCTLRLGDIDEDFLDDFKDFLAEEHESTEKHIYKCKGGMVNKTINKRLECLSAFVRSYYKDIKKAQFIFESRILGNDRNKEIIRLDKDEIKELYNRELKDSSRNMTRDYFVFLCLTGLRFGDFVSINKDNFVMGKDGLVTLSLYTQKTNIRIEIKLTKQAKEIAERYDYKFDGYTNQAFNRAIKELLKDEELFEDEIVTYREVLNQKPQPIKMPRREKITAHTARRTFISTMIENGVQPIHVMHMVGHTKMSTLQIYIDRFSPKAENEISVLEF